MNNEQVEQIIISRKLPVDELDNFWNNLFGFLPATLFFVAGLGPWISKKTTMTIENMWIFLVLGFLIFLYTVYAKMTERYLNHINTGLNRDENENLIMYLSKNENWNKLTNMSYYHEFIFSFDMFNYGFKLTLIPTNDGILINLRNRGSLKGRMPYQFGIETLKLKKNEKQIKNYLQQRL